MTIYNFQQQNTKTKLLYAPVWIDNVFSENEIKELIYAGESAPLQEAEIGDKGRGSFDPTIRRTKISWIAPHNAPNWWPEKLKELFEKINVENYGYELIGAEPVQYTKYESDVSAEYKWHCDTSEIEPNIIRKLSCSILLSDPKEYEGGDLILAPHGNPITIGNKLGRAIFFPSWTPHCVTPVTKGIRKSLVIWASGPMFK